MPKTKSPLYLLLKLLIFTWVIKALFFQYNYTITGGWNIKGPGDISSVFWWAFLYDFLSISILFTGVVIAGLILKHWSRSDPEKKVVAMLFSITISLALLLNCIDIFYYRFHLQRADADILYVLRNPFVTGSSKVWLLTTAALLSFAVGTWYFYKQALKIYSQEPKQLMFSLLGPVFFILVFVASGKKKILPTYPLAKLDPVQLPLVQNSLHTFLYSLYRQKESRLPAGDLLSLNEQLSLFQVNKKNQKTGPAKNIVLFIMESVPLDYFVNSSPYKVPMPFLDSLVSKSSFYTNAFSYSYNSNKGITAILAGLPTVIDIPLYHSNFTSLRRTSIGAELKKHGYSSSFFIGDNYDDFGFAKCCKWLGIDHYYSMEDVPGYKKMEKHSMGLHDETTLGFMRNKLSNRNSPFLAIHYNITTHYPNQVPAAFKKAHEKLGFTPEMRSMLYYNNSLEQFFTAVKNEPWYQNTVFIFCSDHWAQPQHKTIYMDKVESFRIPIFIYEPAVEKGEVITSPVSQLDVMNTILYYSGIREQLISYGSNLKDEQLDNNRTVFSKSHSAVYQAINSQYVMGYNAQENKPIYCYEYKVDSARKINLVAGPVSPAITRMVLQMKAFLQTASNHYREKTTHAVE